MSDDMRRAWMAAELDAINTRIAHAWRTIQADIERKVWLEYKLAALPKEELCRQVPPMASLTIGPTR